MIRFIGDIHGKVPDYEIIAGAADTTVQIGDFGWGWFSDAQKYRINRFHSTPLMGNHRFIRGNHDNPAECAEAAGWIPDGHFEEEHGIMYVGGAWSIDWQCRTPGVSWWPDEELTQEQFAKVYDDYVKRKPRVMVTHDAPNSAILSCFEFPNYFGDFTPTRTSDAFETMLAAHEPDMWIFGHWHIDRDTRVGDTRFICLAELSAADVDPVSLEVSYPQY